MKKFTLTVSFCIAFTFTVLAQANSTAVQKRETVKSTTVQGLKVEGAEGHYCDYCKSNYPESHFPCIMKAIKGKINASTGAVEFMAGDPVPGIDVKLGKNPGGNMVVVANQNGVIELNNLAAGSYKLLVSMPKQSATARVAGNPIGGILVKGGKNPGGNMITVITNENGEITLNNLEAGNYRFTLLGATAAQKNNPLYQSSHTEQVNPLYKGNP